MSLNCGQKRTDLDGYIWKLWQRGRGAATEYVAEWKPGRKSKSKIVGNDVQKKSVKSGVFHKETVAE